MSVPLTREAFEALLLEDSPRGMKAVGRALVALARRQTIDERTLLQTKYKNRIGFSAFDARVGTGNAEFFLHHGFLTAGHLAYWRKPDNKGNVRICKYAEQLLDIAREKQGRIEEKRKAKAAQLSLPL
jgi:hypothetical protein